MTTTDSLDCIIIGAGFAGLRALLEARKRGWDARLIEAGSDVGGTWFWNRYPGARTDSSSWVYCYSFDPELLEEWEWPDRYPSQPQVQAYLGHVADRYGLRSDMELSTRVTHAWRDEAQNAWTVQTDTGKQYSCTYLIPAVGPLHMSYLPPFQGLESFTGEFYMTSKWPQDPVDFDGKRVAVIGTGSTGVQLIPQVAKAAGHLTVLQRTPNYVVPARNGPIDETEKEAVRRDYPQIWEKVRGQVFGFPMDTAGRVLADLDEAEARRILEWGWEMGGFHFLFETFDDILVNQTTNDFVCAFIRDKIRNVVRDPEVAELLCPTNHPYGAKRPPQGTYYYETYNRENVSLVDLRQKPIASVNPRGLVFEDGSEQEFDMLIFATGFDAATGALTAIDIRGSQGQSLAESWRDGAKTHLGISVAGFPNMFFVGGPGMPFGNFPPSTEVTVAWIADLIDHLGACGAASVEAEVAAMDAWVQKLQDIIDDTLLGQGEAVRAWFLGANIDGKTHTPLFYLGGHPAYYGELEQCASSGYAGFSFNRALVEVPVPAMT